MPRQPEEVGAAPPGRQKLAPGVVARIQGLKGATDLNGAEAICEQWHAESGRWSVRLASGEEKRVRPENLTAKAAEGSSSGEHAAFKAGAAVRLWGLQASPELNGSLATCESWVSDVGRWIVRLESGHEKRVRPENLRAAEPGVSVLGRSGAAASLRRSYVALARANRPGAADDGCDDFVVADAAPAAAAAPAAVGAAQGPAATSSKSRVEAAKAGADGAAGRRPRAEGGGQGQPFQLRQAVWTGERGAEQRRKRPREASPDAMPAPESPDPEEGTEVAEGLRCPSWLWEALYAHQQEGVRWLWNLHRNKQGGILADDLGLGKTVQTIAYLASLHHSGCLRREASQGILVVCPVTLLRQWQKEIRIWYSRLDVRVIHQLEEKARKEAFAAACGPQRVAITSYEMLRACGSDIVEVPWAVVILDEGQKIRNPHGLGTHIAKTFDTPHRIILTGSPVHNNLQELWSLMDFVRPGCLGTLPVFTEEMARPIEAGSAAGVEPARAAAAYQTASALREMTKPAILRRTKPEVMEAIQLPKKEEQVLLCHLTTEQYAAYLGFVQSQQASHLRSGSRESGHVMHAINVCRRLCNHPDFLLGESDSSLKPPDMWNYERSGKMKVLVEAMRQWFTEGHRVLVFVQTMRMLEVLGELMERQGYRHLRMDSRTPVSKRVRTIEEFNGDTNLFAMVLTTRIGGVGLNIIGADRVVLFDPDWNPMTDIQARERAWRIGQRREVGVFRLLLAGTLEEKIYQRQMAKQQLSQQVFSAGSCGQAFGRGRLIDAFALPPPPPSVDESKLSALKEKYKLLFKGSAPSEEADDQESSADIVQAVVDLGGEPPATSREAPGGGGSALLQTLFDSRGIRASFNGDSVERMLVDRRNVREGASALAMRAVAAVQRSVAEHAGRSINEPTWTGKHGTVGAPQKAAERQAEGASSSCSAGGGGERPSKRSKGPSPDVMAGVEWLTKRRRPFSETQRGLAETILTAFLDKEFAGPRHSLSTSQVLQHAAGRVPVEQRGAFKSLLQLTCTLSKPTSPDEPGLWILRPEFLPKAERRKAAAGTASAARTAKR
mmetsp:Transcript_75136/g.220203  ORF Transcript_75136/g.220203 Transcript_75136/m.220203 type:complete len:1065 (-) Transcript_75136:152-3346(-)